MLVHQSAGGPKNYDEWNETHKVNAELPHVFLKHKNEKTRVEKKKKGKRDMEKRARQLHGKGGRDVGGGVGTVVSGVRGGLQAEQHVKW